MVSSYSVGLESSGILPRLPCVKMIPQQREDNSHKHQSSDLGYSQCSCHNFFIAIYSIQVSSGDESSTVSIPVGGISGGVSGAFVVLAAVIVLLILTLIRQKRRQTAGRVFII